jgi:hypothetical protein
MSGDKQTVHIVKKYQHGWVVRDPESDTTTFLSNTELAEKGWIPSETPPQNIKRPPASAPRVILVPSERPRSMSTRNADSDPNWRDRSFGLSQSAPESSTR